MMKIKREYGEREICLCDEGVTIVCINVCVVQQISLDIMKEDRRHI